MLFQAMSCKCLRFRPVIALKVLVYDLFFSLLILIYFEGTQAKQDFE